MIISNQNQTTTADSFSIGDTEVFPVEFDTEPFLVTSDAGETFLFISADLSPDQAEAKAIEFLGV